MNAYVKQHPRIDSRMPRPIITDDALLLSAESRWDRAVLGIVAALLVFMPAAFGAVEAWSELLVMAGAAALGACLALRAAVERDFAPRGTWVFLPLALLVLLVAWQIAPLPVGLVEWLSPATLATQRGMLGDDWQAAPRTTLSLNPHATAHHLRLLLVGSTLFAAAAVAFRSAREIKTLLAVVFVIGCVQAALALAQIATAADKFYWTIDAGRGVLTSGTFVNYSHFSQFMNLSLGAGIALLLVRLHETRSGRGRSPSPGAVRLDLEKQGWIVCGLVLCGIAVFTSMSRNGALSLVLALAVAGTLLYARGSLSGKGWLVGIVPLGVLAGLLVFGFDAVYERLATLEERQAYEGRWEMFSATLRAWQAYPVWGTGLGTHEFVFPMFDTAVTPVVAAHADNEYAQLLEEMGLVGAALVAALLAGIALLAGRLILRGRTPLSTAAFGLLFGLVAVAIHSATDFGQRVPAVFGLSAILCGLVVAIARLEERERRRPGNAATPRRSQRTAFRRAGAVAALALLAAVWGWALTRAYGSYMAEQWWSAALALEAQIHQPGYEPTDEDYIDLLAAAQSALENDPGQVKYAYFLNQYRWQSLSRDVDPQTGGVVLHPDALELVERIADELTAARRLCPTYGPPYALEGQLRLYVLRQERGAELIQKGVRLAGYDPPTCLAAGELAARRGELQEAETLLVRAVALRPAYYREVVELFLGVLRRPDLARALAGDDHRRLDELARLCAADPDYADLAEGLFAEAEESLRRRVLKDDASPTELAALGRIDFDRGHYDSAIELYRRALGRNYRQIDWRLTLARALVESGQLEEAMREARVCLRLRPGHAAARRLVEELSLRVPAP